MKWRTAISTHKNLPSGQNLSGSTSKNGELYVKGKGLSSLIEERSFTEVIFLLLKGNLPNKKETAILDAILVAMCEHGIAAPSTFVARTAISTGNPFNSALAAGILAIGDWHGGAIEKCAYYLQSGKSAKTIVENVLKDSGRMSGYGHKIYKDIDPRTQIIIKKAKKLEFYGKYFILALEIENELHSQTEKKLPFNIDGAVAAVMLELGVDWRLGKALFALGRLPGLIAHTYEELTREKPYRRLEESDIEYNGPEITNNNLTI